MHIEDPDSPETDAALVARAIQGDSEAFGDLYDRYLSPLYLYVFYRVASHNEAEDLTEIVFIKAWEGLGRLKQDRLNFRAWLYRIAHNTVVDHFRTSKSEISLENLSNQHHPNPSPEEAFQDQLEAARLAKAISQLKTDQQQVIACRFIAGLSHIETAEIMNLKEGHVRVLQHRALLQLKTLLAE